MLFPDICDSLPSRMPRFHIRPASSHDFASITAIAQRTWPTTFGTILSAAQIAYMLEMMYAPEALERQVAQGHRFLLALQTEQALGYASYELDYLAGVTKIHKLYVLPQTQGNGLGRQLIDRVTSIAAAAGQQRIRLDVNYQNTAVGFYRHLGFQIVSRQDTDIGQGFLMEDYVMEKNL